MWKWIFSFSFDVYRLPAHGGEDDFLTFFSEIFLLDSEIDGQKSKWQIEALFKILIIFRIDS